MFKSARPKRLLIIIFWLIIIFIAILRLPSITHSVTSLNERNNNASQTAQSEQLINADRLQHKWGRHLGHTSTADIVYNRKDGQITTHQQNQINRHVQKLQKHAREYGIHKITDLNTDRNGSDELKSPDNSTEIVQLSVIPKYQNSNANIWVDEIKSQTKVPKLRSSLTSPQLLKSASARTTVNRTIVMTIVGILLSSLVIGLLFKSFIAPLISSITLLVTDLVTLSLTSNLAIWTGFNELTPFAILIGILTVGTVMTYFIYQAIMLELPNHRDPNNAVKKGLKYVKQPIELSGLILTIALGAAILIPEVNVRSITSLGITFAILTLAELTLIPTFTSWLGFDILWPSHQYTKPSGHKLWNRLARLSLWQPLIGIIAVIYFIVPFASSYRNNIEYAQANNLPTDNQAYQGNNELNTHFTSGKSTPVTIYLKSPQKFNHEATLKPIDDLTTKLQSMPGINAVYSITQPSSMPINKYYVNHQLTTVNNTLNRNQDQLYQASKQLRQGQKKLGRYQLNQIRKRLSKLNTIHNDVPNANLDNQLKGLTNGQKASITTKINTYRNQLQNLNGKLTQLSSNLNNLNTVNNDVKNYQNQIKTVSKKINTTTKELSRVNIQLNNVYSYLSNLKQSSASHQYFITPDQIQDTDFQQSLINFTSQNERITKLKIVFNQAPSTHYNSIRLKRLKNEIQTTLQGTSLAHANIALSGVPVQQATIQRHFKTGIIKALLIISGIILISLMLISRSILNPILGVVSFIISAFAGLQITELIVRYTTSQAQFNWQLILTIITTLTGLAIVELLPLSLAYRHRQVSLLEWLHETFTSLGQNVTAIITIIIFTMAALFMGMTTQFTQISLIIIITVIIFNWVLPLLVNALDKYAKTLPHSKL